MGYQALLFCPEEKTARVVVQLLNDLEFSVESCNEPFVAVKKLMAQHFDGLVVDCENEQNATLLFKGARNSGLNQSALMVAIVEGQTGVAKAFRIGANLVLTKPINIEQSKGTLRVARGLLRKGETAKTAASPVDQPVAAMPVPSALTAPAAHSEIPTPAASSSAFELEAEPAPAPGEAEAALLEYMPDSVAAKGSATTSAAPPGTKDYPWQPAAKSLGEPMASALRRAAEAAGEAGSAFVPSGRPSAPQINAAASPARQTPVTSLAAASSFAAAAAPAPKKLHEITEPAVAEPASVIPEPPKFAALDAAAESSASSGGTRKFLLVAIVVLAGAAGYLGWNRLHPNTEALRNQPVPAPRTPAANVAPVQTEPPAPPSAEVTPDSVPTIAVDPSQVEITRTPIAQPEQPSSALSSKSSTAKPAAGIAPAPSAKASAETTGQAESDAEEPITVKSNPDSGTTSRLAAPESEPVPAPPTIAMDSGADSKTLSGIVKESAPTLPATVPKTIKISQGVSQGLIIKRVQPEYPAMARQIRLQGAVHLEAVIGKDGNIRSVKQISGDPTLGKAAVTAVRQWQYKPYILDGDPVEVQTEITVDFKLP